MPNYYRSKDQDTEDQEQEASFWDNAILLEGFKNFYFDDDEWFDSIDFLSMTLTNTFTDLHPNGMYILVSKEYQLSGFLRKSFRALIPLIVKPETEVPKPKVPKSRPKGLGLTL